MTQQTFQAQPFALPFDSHTTALVMIDMQRDFVEAGGFGEALGNDVSLVRSAIEPCTKVLAAARDKGLLVIHTREGHRADLSDCRRRNSPAAVKLSLAKQALWDAFWFGAKPVTTLSLNCTRSRVNRLSISLVKVRFTRLIYI